MRRTMLRSDRLSRASARARGAAGPTATMAATSTATSDTTSRVIGEGGPRRHAGPRRSATAVRREAGHPSESSGHGAYTCTRLPAPWRESFDAFSACEEARHALDQLRPVEPGPVARLRDVLGAPVAQRGGEPVGEAGRDVAVARAVQHERGSVDRAELAARRREQSPAGWSGRAAGSPAGCRDRSRPARARRGRPAAAGAPQGRRRAPSRSRPRPACARRARTGASGSRAAGARCRSPRSARSARAPAARTPARPRPSRASPAACARVPASSQKRSSQSA